MDFTLHYSGPLRSNGKPEHKHELRRAFHVQLAELWRHEPLRDKKSYQLPLESPDRKDWEKVCSLRPVGPFNFVPLVTKDLRLVATLDLTLLRPEPPGRLITEGGDIDNRLKTLFDALSLPQAGGLPQGAQPGPKESPFFTVLEDDNLITSVSVHTRHLLKPQDDTSHVELFVTVRLERTSATMANSGLV